MKTINTALLFAFVCAVFLQSACSSRSTGKEAYIQNIEVKLVKKSVEESLGIKAEMGTFSVINNSSSSLVLAGYRQGGHFFLWYPIVSLQQKPMNRDWQSTFYVGDYPYPPDKLVISPNSEEEFISSIHPDQTGLDPSALLRLLIRPTNTNLPLVSESFSQ